MKFEFKVKACIELTNKDVTRIDKLIKRTVNGIKRWLNLFVMSFLLAVFGHETGYMPIKQNKNVVACINKDTATEVILEGRNMDEGSKGRSSTRLWRVNERLANPREPVHAHMRVAAQRF